MAKTIFTENAATKNNVLKNALLKRKKFVFVAGLLLALVALLEAFSYFKSDSGMTYALTSLCVLVVVAGILAYALSFLRRLRHSVSKINRFLSLASLGHLESRITPNENDSFVEITEIMDGLNVMMENLEKMSRAKSDFLSSMSHEIRTPMSAVIGMSQIAKKSADLNRIKDCLQKIEDNSKHLVGVINDILDFSKIESGKFLLDAQLFSLRENIDFIRSMFEEKTSEKNINFEVVVENVTNDGIVTDSLRLNQVLINLLSNAVKFTDPGGMVRLSVKEIAHMNDESVYSFAVSDNGIGIDPAAAQKLFSPFVQASASTTKKYGGTGLGLVISKSIVEKMGGDIELESELGEGSTFSFIVRVQSQPLAKTAEEMASGDTAPDFRGKRLLIVDDIAINLEIAVEILRETGVEMETADNGKKALDMFEASPIGYYDLIFMDMQMPIMDGCESTKSIRELGREDAKSIKIIAVTANVMRDDIKKAMEAGMDGHIGKPIDFTEAYKTMSSMLR
ncbi:hypothetical protein AGMMS50276_19870 [Synergistales bacterium]|nr:hypothetical protein AGMMS50276_19870 [Synergistales bacterium]